MRASGSDQGSPSVLRKIDAMPLLPEKKRALREAALDLLQDPLVRGVAIFGSASRGEPDPRDFDLIVLVPGKETWTRRRLYGGHSIHLQMRGVARFRAMNIDRRQTRSEQRPAFADLLVLWMILTASRGRALDAAVSLRADRSRSPGGRRDGSRQS